jgi:CDGSH-type Zn-finger protein/uncharacterized Fe-S cluster protein YjdI
MAMAPKMKTRTYHSEAINVHYNVRRCIHAEECVQRLGEVFDINKRPWIQPDQATADQVVDTISHCPTGALHYERLDGGPAEAVPEVNTIILEEDGPVYLSGNLVIQNADGEQVHTDTRLALCRCGVSENKPFCDNTHLQYDFQASGTAAVLQNGEPNRTAGGVLVITPVTNGSVHIEGNFELRDAEGELLYRGTDTWLCRCGGSANKPFCDGTHRQNDFQAESW